MKIKKKSTASNIIVLFSLILVIFLISTRIIYSQDSDGDGITGGHEVLDNTSVINPCESIGGTLPDGSPCGIAIENKLMTTDGDGINDTFSIMNIDLYPNNTVEIYNRWGVKVFTTQGYHNETNAFKGVSNGRATVRQNNKQKR